MSKNIEINRKKDKKKILIGALCLVAGIAFVAGMSILIYREVSKDSSESGNKQEELAKKAEELEDGEVFDFEEAGFLKLGTYKGLTADVQPEDEEVYSEMIAVAEENEVKEDKRVKEGDLVNIAFTGKLDGEELEDASDDDAYVWIGKNEYIEDFEKGIIGMEKGEKKKIDCKFPSDYDDEELAGKTVQFTIEVYEKFSDKTAQKASDGKYKTVQTYFEYEKENQLAENRSSKGELVWDSLKENVEVKSAPEKMTARAMEDITNMYTNFAQLSDTTVEDLLAQFGMEEDGIEEIANDTVIDQMIAKTIAAKEGITMDDVYYEAKLKEILGLNEKPEEGGVDEETAAAMTLESLEQEYRDTMGSRPKDDMLIERVREYIGEQSKESSVQEEDE